MLMLGKTNGIIKLKNLVFSQSKRHVVVSYNTAGDLFVVFTLFSAKVLVFAIIVGIIAFLFLECVNYIEHYGLRRFKNDSGRYERVQTYHSWNSNHNIGRIVLYELTRHSDHHYKSSKKYQLLNCYEESLSFLMVTLPTPFKFCSSFMVFYYGPFGSRKNEKA